MGRKKFVNLRDRSLIHYVFGVAKFISGTVKFGIFDRWEKYDNISKIFSSIWEKNNPLLKKLLKSPQLQKPPYFTVPILVFAAFGFLTKWKEIFKKSEF